MSQEAISGLYGGCRFVVMLFFAKNSCTTNGVLGPRLVVMHDSIGGEDSGPYMENACLEQLYGTNIELSND